MTAQATPGSLNPEKKRPDCVTDVGGSPFDPSLWDWLTGQGDPILATSRLTVALSSVVILAAGVLGFTALHDLFIAIGLFHPVLGYLFPILFDAAEVTFAVSTLNAQLQGEEDHHAWRMVIVFTFLGIMANMAHAIFAGVSGTITTGQAILAVLFTSLFPLSIAFVTHNLKNSIKRHIKRNSFVKTLAQLMHDIQQRQIGLQLLADQQAQLEYHQTELKAQMESERQQFGAERSVLEQQKVHLEQEITALRQEYRETRRGTGLSGGPAYPELTLETQHQAYAYLAEQVRQGKRNKEITGAELGRAIGTSDSFGRRLKKRLLPQVRADLKIPESIIPSNGTHQTDG